MKTRTKIIGFLLILVLCFGLGRLIGVLRSHRVKGFNPVQGNSSSTNSHPVTVGRKDVHTDGGGDIIPESGLSEAHGVYEGGRLLVPAKAAMQFLIGQIADRSGVLDTTFCGILMISDKQMLEFQRIIDQTAKLIVDRQKQMAVPFRNSNGFLKHLSIPADEEGIAREVFQSAIEQLLGDKSEVLFANSWVTYDLFQLHFCGFGEQAVNYRVQEIDLNTVEILMGLDEDPSESVFRGRFDKVPAKLAHIIVLWKQNTGGP